MHKNEFSFDTLTQKDPFAHFYNTSSLTDVFLTCDVDWAPDHCIDIVVKKIESFGFKMTFFATHPSTYLQQLNTQQFEVGLHPDFTRQKETFEESLKKVKEWYPSANGMRAHRNLFGQNISDLAKRYDLRYDISTFLWLQPFQQIFIDYNGLIKIPYFWEDGIHLDTGVSLEQVIEKLNAPGLKVINCHPALLSLNSPNETHRRNFTSNYKDLTVVPQESFVDHRFSGDGIFNLWVQLLTYLKQKNVKTHLASKIASK